MNDILRFNRDSYKILYYRYKVFFAPLAVFLACLLLLFYGIIPQITTLSNATSDKKELSEKIGRMKKNSQFLLSLNSSELDTNLDVLLRALPPQKDFASILLAISKASSKTGISLLDFGFEVGNVSAASAMSDKPFLQFSVSLQSGLEGALEFMRELENQLPLSDVKNIQTSGASTVLTLVFYYHSLTPPRFEPSTLFVPYTGWESGVLRKVVELEQRSAQLNFVATSSAKAGAF